MSKLCSLADAVADIPNGAMLALGGNTLNRAPMAAVRELARQQKKDLRLVKTAGALDIDLLCLAGCVRSLDAGFVSHESQFSLCKHYRRAVEGGRIQVFEHACYTVINALRAAAYGIPFMPVKGLQQTQLMEANPRLTQTADPFGGPAVAAVQALRPDWAILHVHQADPQGNACIQGPPYEDLLMSQAAVKVLITAEEIVSEDHFRRQDHKAQIPGFQVSDVAHAPRGAWPTAMAYAYPADEEDIRAYLRLEDLPQLTSFLEGRRETAP